MVVMSGFRKHLILPLNFSIFSKFLRVKRSTLLKSVIQTTSVGVGTIRLYM